MITLIKDSIKITLILVGVSVIVLTLAGKVSWAEGFLLANIWSGLNFFFTIKILNIALLKQSKARLLLLLLVKFPLLYLAGFLILAARIFPYTSLLAGLLPILLVTGILKIWPRHN